MSLHSDPSKLMLFGAGELCVINSHYAPAMENETMKLVCQNELHEITLRQINHLCRKRFDQDVDLDPILPVLNYDIGTISSIAGLIVGLVALCLQIRDQRKSTSNSHTFNSDSASDFIVTEVKSLEVHTVKEVKLSSFSSLVEMNGQACKVSAYDSTIHHNLSISVSLTRDSCTISKCSFDE